MLFCFVYLKIRLHEAKKERRWDRGLKTRRLFLLLTESVGRWNQETRDRQNICGGNLR
jgi:hypothetical protein